MKIRSVALVLALAALTGCVTNPVKPQPSSMEEVALTVQVSRDDFKKKTSFNGPRIPAGPFDTLFLRAWKLDGQPTQYQIYVADYYQAAWRFYTSAHDSDGMRFDVTLISRDVGSCSRYGGCSHFEHMALNVTRDYLEAAASKGVTFQISGKTGDQVFSVPPMHVAGFLASVPR